MTKYFKKRDSNHVDCYFELDIKNNCLRAIFISDVFDDYNNLYYIEDEKYQMPNLFTEPEINNMKKIQKTDFEIQWEKNYTGKENIKFLLKHILLAENN